MEPVEGVQDVAVEVADEDAIVAGVGDGDPVSVIGPDWALLAWLVGRPAAAAAALSATPELPQWA